MTLTLNTSIVNFFNSVMATSQFRAPGGYYYAPTRQFSFDQNYLQYDKQPPGTPLVCATPTSPSISAQPQSQTVIVGQTAMFTVWAIGALPLSYQWQLMGTGIPGATNSSFTIPSASTSDAGSYSVIVTNALGSAVSSNAVLTVNLAISGLYNTGVNNDGTPAALDTVDSHYALVSVPSGSAGTAWVVAPFPSAWWSGTTNANWLSPVPGGAGGIGYSADVGQYDYRLVFSMVDTLGHPLDPTTATITGSWAADNQVSLLLNGIPVATNDTGYGSLSSFAVSSGFCAGTNTLDFLVINTPPAGANPSGLLVSELSGSAGFSGPFPATATATLVDGFVVAATVTNAGYGYTNTPLVRFIGGGGSGAQAVAVVSNGVVVGITITDAGIGYTNAPLVVIEPPFIPNPVLGIAPMSFLSFSNLTVGGVYQLQQSVAWYWSNQPVSFTATNALYTQMVAGVAGSGDYRLALNPVPAQAFATPAGGQWVCRRRDGD